MAVFDDCDLTFPAPPPPRDPKPVLKKGERYEPIDKYSLWGAHDPAVFRDPVTQNYYTYCTGAIARRSQDLIVWENIGKVVADPPPEAVAWVGSNAIWAPDIIKVEGEYRLYCSNSTWGVRQSCIFLAVADNPEGPFVPRGIVLKTSDQSPVNAIDANPVADQRTGEHYMAYGSFWGGCHILRLDPATGLAAEDGIGKCIARRPPWTDCAIEGPYITYNPDTEYYYLFVSYGFLASDYNIRVGRSRSITGPYLDHNGRDLTDLDDHSGEVGYMAACGYRFHGSPGVMAPGHNSVLRDSDGQWYLVCHVREHDFFVPQIATMHVYKMFWTDDGWPVITPQCYAGEEQQPVNRKLIAGRYERIKLAPAVPQSVINSVPMILAENGEFRCCSLKGRWEQIEAVKIKIEYGKVEEICFVTPAWDWQRHEPTLCLTGKDQFGIAVWGKKI